MPPKNNRRRRLLEDDARKARRRRNPINDKFYGDEHWSYDSLLLHRVKKNKIWIAFWILITMIGCIAGFVSTSVLGLVEFAKQEPIVTTAVCARKLEQ